MSYGFHRMTSFLTLFYSVAHQAKQISTKLDYYFPSLGGCHVRYSVSNQTSAGVQTEVTTLPKDIMMIPIRDNILFETELLVKKLYKHSADPTMRL